MNFELLSFWNHEISIGFLILSFDFDRDDDMIYGLFGFSYNKEERALQFDIFWKCIEFKLHTP